MTYYLLGKTTKSCLRVAWLAARHWPSFYTFLTDGFYFSPEAERSENSQGRGSTQAVPGTMTDTSAQHREG